MYKRKTLFIGCGDGREMVALAKDREHLLIGLEPIDQLYARARERTNNFPHIKLYHCRIQDFPATVYAGGMNQIYFIFPTPEVLRREAKAIVGRVYSLLAEETGRFRLYTEITLTEWPDLEDRARLKCFLESLEGAGLFVEVREINYNELPPMTRQSECGLKFKAHGITRYTAVEAWKGKLRSRTEVIGQGD